MKRPLVAAAGLTLALACGLAGAAPWTVIVPPGVYGRVAIGGYAEPPQVVSPQPIMAVDNGDGQVVEEVVDAAYATDQPPIYLWVPEYQRAHWAQFSHEYGATGVPVYFVDDRWYRANVLGRNWTPEQRSWTPQQWAEQDRLARDRLERVRFEQQRAQLQQRWLTQRAWYGRQVPQTAAASQPRETPRTALGLREKRPAEAGGERRGGLEPGRGRFESGRAGFEPGRGGGHREH